MSRHSEKVVASVAFPSIAAATSLDLQAALSAERAWKLQWADEFNGSIDYSTWNNWRDKTWRANGGRTFCPRIEDRDCQERMHGGEPSHARGRAALRDRRLVVE